MKQEITYSINGDEFNKILKEIKLKEEESLVGKNGKIDPLKTEESDPLKLCV